MYNSRQSFSEGYAGLAYVNTMCSPESSCSVVRICSRCDDLPIVMAHEVGHNLGLNHDKDNCMCQARKTCIMQGIPHSSEGIGMWSNCSVEFLANSSETHRCVHNVPKRLFKSPTCGNGFVEPGEQCDCGTHGYRTGQPAGPAGGGTNPCHACCHPDTCMLRGNATCGAGACCDFTTCSVKSAGVLCRAAERECDLPEYCSGHSEYCPADVYKMDSTPCGVGDNQAYCVRGACNSHADHCRLLWGASGTNHDECYVKNTEGILNGNCGYDPISRRYIACAPSDTRCGLLQCRTQEYRLHHAIGDGVNTPVWAYARNNQREDCYIANFNVEPSNADFGLVPDGAKCGHEQMCLKQRCVHVEDVREEISRRVHSACPSHCSGHGVCNSNGHCHCDAGFAPPRCAYQGLGGSDDSGPATKLSRASSNFIPNYGLSSSRPNNKPNYDSVTRNIKIALYVIFLGIVPLIILLLLVYYTRHNALWKQPMKLYANNVACCIKKLPKYANKMKTITKGIGSDIGDKDETDKNFAQLSNDSKLNKPVTNTIDSNQIYSNDVRMKPLVALRKPALKPVKPKLNISKDDIQILTNDMASKPDNPISKIDNDENTFVSNGVTLKAINPMTVNDNNNIQVAINNIKLNHINTNPKIDNGHIKSQINHVKLKPVPTTGNDASARGVEKVPIKLMLNVNNNHVQTEINNVKLKPIKLSPKVNNDIQTKITDVNLKPVQPLVTSKPKPLVTPKPELLNLK